MSRIRRSAVIAGVVATLLVTLGCWMVVAGWPLQTPRENALMDLAQLPMCAAVLVAIVEMAYERRLWQRTSSRAGLVFGVAGVLFLLGLVGSVVAFATEARTWLGIAQLAIWTGLGLAFGYLAIDSVRRELRSAPRLEPVDEADDAWLDSLEAEWADEPDEPDAGDEGEIAGDAPYQAPPLLPPTEPVTEQRHTPGTRP